LLKHVDAEPLAAVAPEADSSYDPECFDRLAAVEDRHFWFRARAQVIAAVARRITVAFDPGYRVLEVGCGSGKILGVLEPACPGSRVFGMDLHREGLRHARRRCSQPLVQADILAPPFRASFHLIGLFDVLEHLGDDVAVLERLRPLLAPQGLLLITVPAHPSLWSYFDEWSHHRRRYTAAELRRSLAAAGYQLDFLSPYMCAIFPLLWLGRRIASLRRRPAGELAGADLQVVPVVNEALAWLLSLEAPWLARRRRLPLGTSILAIARAARQPNFANS